MQNKSKLLTAILCAVPSIVHAAADDSLGEVVVTATRLEQPLNQTLSSTTVITLCLRSRRRTLKKSPSRRSSFESTTSGA